MLTRALAVLVDGPALAWSWFVADAGYGRDPGLRAFCHLPIRYSLAAIRGLLAATILARDCLDWTAAITRDHWRRTHQTRAKISHYHRRHDALPKDL